MTESCHAENVARAAQAFVQKLDRLAPSIDNAFAVGALHGFSYHGETGEAELNQLKDALRAWEVGG